MCTGNLCRSPTLEQLLRLRLGEAFPDADINVTSAGTHAYDGDPMDPGSAHEAERLGIRDAERHRARRLVEPHVRDADLVLALAREHRTAAVRLAPRAVGRAFTLLEFVRIVESLEPKDLVAGRDSATPEGRLRRVVEAAHRIRGLVASRRRSGMDVIDPHGREPDVYRASADTIDDACRRLIAVLPRLVDPPD
ncbi:hypothetical protein ACQBAU_02895 [Propionibacteriaceae bacterium Y2011]